MIDFNPKPEFRKQMICNIPIGHVLTVGFIDSDGELEIHFDTPEFRKQIVIKDMMTNKVICIEDFRTNDLANRAALAEANTIHIGDLPTPPECNIYEFVLKLKKGKLLKTEPIKGGTIAARTKQQAREALWADTRLKDYTIVSVLAPNK